MLWTSPQEYIWKTQAINEEQARRNQSSNDFRIGKKKKIKKKHVIYHHFFLPPPSPFPPNPQQHYQPNMKLDFFSLLHFKMVFVHSKTLQYSTQSTPSLISFPNVAFKTILMFVWTALFALKSLTLYRPCFPQPEQHISLERLPGLLFAVGDLPFLQNCLSWSPWCYSGPALPTEQHAGLERLSSP